MIAQHSAHLNFKSRVGAINVSKAEIGSLLQSLCTRGSGRGTALPKVPGEAEAVQGSFSLAHLAPQEGDSRLCHCCRSPTDPCSCPQR